MIERSIQHLRAERPAATETAEEARERLGALFPRGALRRMTHLGLLVGATLDGLAVGADDTIVYATTYSETRALEDYLASFPAPSPLLFQLSIHPSAVQQVLIGRQRSVRRFVPLTGRRRLVEHALLAALLDPAPRVVLAGGEERGTWLLDHGVASDRAFAFALGLAAGPDPAATGRLTFDEAPSASAADPCPSLPAWADALAERRPLRWRGFGGAYALEWTG